MNKIFIPLIIFSLFSFSSKKNQYIARQGQISFFSYTSVENIEAVNKQVLSILDLDNKKIAISMLMRAFAFKKELMYEHFNESYIESDIYPKATFEGDILDFDPNLSTTQTKIIKGALTIHGITKEVELKATIVNNKNNTYLITGTFNIIVKDFEIKIPPILSSNIAKNISVNFRFEYNRYEK